MTHLRDAEIDRFLAHPAADKAVVLFFGPDPGSVSERAAALTHRLIGDDLLAVRRFDESDLAAEPGMLADEANGASLFSGRRVIRIRAAGNRSIATDLRPILEAPPENTWIVIEAGDLRKTAALRKLCEDDARAAAIGCYPDNDASLGQLIDTETAGAGLQIEPEARAVLVSLLGADRAASRSEIRKLCLYAQSGDRITIADVTASIGDGAAFATDDVVYAAAMGDHAALDRGFRRLLAAGTAASTIGTATERHFLLLHRLQSAIDHGTNLSAATQSLRPPPLPSRRVLIERQLQLWPLESLNNALQRLNQAMIDSRLHPAISGAVIARCLVALAALAKRRSRRRAA